MFPVITNIYNKKTKGPTLMELFTATGKLKGFFLTHKRVNMLTRVCGKNLNVVSMGAVPPVVHTTNISSC